MTPIKNTKNTTTTNSQNHKNEYEIKVANYLSGLWYMLGPYRLPIIYENKQDQSVICIIPEHPKNLVEEYLNQFPRDHATNQGIT